MIVNSKIYLQLLLDMAATNSRTTLGIFDLFKLKKNLQFRNL